MKLIKALIRIADPDPYIKNIYIRKKLKHKINNTNTVMCKMGNTAWLVVFTLESQFIIQNKSINSLTT